MNETISLILPVYNVEEYLPKCMDSLIAQTYTNLEIILINDGSTDKSGELCDYYKSKDKRVKVFHQENAGVGKARNVGLDNATGEWIGFVDPDDWVNPDMFEKLLNAAVQNEAQVSACGYLKYSGESFIHDRSFPNAPEKIPCVEAMEYIFNHQCYEGVLWNKLYRRSLIEGAKIRFNTGFYACSDEAFIVDVMLSGKSLAYVPEALYHHIKRDGSITMSFKEKRLAALKAWEYIIDRLSPVSDYLAHLARFRYTETAATLTSAAANYGGHAHLPMLKKEGRRYIIPYLFSRKRTLKMKIRCFSIIMFPRSSNYIWQRAKKRLNITWWTNNLVNKSRDQYVRN